MLEKWSLMSNPMSELPFSASVLLEMCHNIRSMDSYVTYSCLQPTSQRTKIKWQVRELGTVT